MIIDPVLRVMCDGCGNEEEFPLTATARGGYDERGLNSYLKRWGWEIVDENTHYCQECVEEMKKEEKNGRGKASKRNSL